MGRTRIAIIGLGMAVDPHARGLLDLADEVEVAAAYAPSAARRAAFGARFPFPLADDLDAILADPAIDAVAVFTPASTHCDIALRAARVGKHVLMEKPLDTTTARAVELVDGCRAAGVALGVVLQHRFKPAALRLAALLAEGTLGGIVGCSTRVQLWRPQSYYDEPGRGTYARDGGGVLMSQAIHTLDLMLSLTGPITEVSAHVATTPIHRMESEDMVSALVRFANGAAGTIEATTAAFPGFPEEILIVGEAGTARISGSALDVAFRDGRRERLDAETGAGGTGADPMAFPYHHHRAVMADFVAAIRSGRPPKVTGEAALAAHRLIDALVASGRSGGPVTVAGSPASS